MPICKTQKGKANFKFCHVHYMYAFNSYLSYSLRFLFQYLNLCPLVCLYLITNKHEQLLIGSKTIVKIVYFLYDNTHHQMLLSSVQCFFFFLEALGLDHGTLAAYPDRLLMAFFSLSEKFWACART